MEQDTKMTYIVIALLIVALGGVAYFLRGSSFTGGTTDKVATTTPDKATTTTKTTTQPQNTTTPKPPMTSSTTPLVVTGAILHTNLGDIEVAFDIKKENTVINFVTLASTKFYEGIRFHRVIKGFMIQAGDPLSKDPTVKTRWGTGGPGYAFKDEIVGNEKYPQGTLAMANAGPNTNGSQFFIVTASPEAPLTPAYTVFGRVVKGMDIALKIENVQTDNADRPVQDVIIQSVEIK